MKKLTVAALAVTTLLSGSAFAHEAGEFFMRAGSATVRPTEGAGGTLGSLGGFSVTNNTQLGLRLLIWRPTTLVWNYWRHRRFVIKLAQPQPGILRQSIIYRQH